jgi:hypothetical protein
MLVFGVLLSTGGKVVLLDTAAVSCSCTVFAALLPHDHKIAVHSSIAAEREFFIRLVFSILKLHNLTEEQNMLTGK